MANEGGESDFDAEEPIPGAAGDDDDDKESRSELKKLWCGVVAAHPIGCIAMTLLTLGFIGLTAFLAFVPFELCLNASFSDFQVSGSEIVQNSFITDLLTDTSYKELILGSGSRRRRAARRLRTWTTLDYNERDNSATSLYVFYYSKKTDDILTEAMIEEVHEVEQSIKDFAGYHNRSLLYSDGGSYEELAPNSFLNYLYPSSEGGYQILDGNGDNLCCDVKETAIELAEGGNYAFFDYTFDIYDRPDVKSDYIIAIYEFGYARFINYQDNTYSYETEEELEKWILGYDDLLKNSGSSTLGVAYADSDGVILYDQLISYVLADLELAAVSIIFIFVVVWVYTRSVFLTTFGLFGVMASFAPSLWLFQVFYGEVFNIVNVVAIWVILGIGADDIFVFMAAYRRAPLETVDGRVIPNYLRMSFAYREAGAAMFCTSFTTSCSFASLMFSSISPLPQFGFFMACLVLMNFLLVMTWFPCLLQFYIWFVQLFMVMGLSRDGCNRFLSVPVAIKKDKKDVFSSPKLDAQDSWVFNARPSHAGPGFGSTMNVMGAMGSRHSGRNSGLMGRNDSGELAALGNGANGENGGNGANGPPRLTNQRSSQFVGGITPGMAAKRKTLVRTLSRKLDRQASQNGWDVDEEWSDCVHLYWAVQRYTGLPLILFMFIMIIVLGIGITNVGAPTQTASLLPEWTNFGIVQDAYNSMDVCEDCFDTGDSSSGNIAVEITWTTLEPTASPSGVTAAPVPTIALNIPTSSPTTSEPTPAPTNMPSVPPTRPPTTPLPTRSPTLQPTLPTPAPTNSPTDPTGIPTNAPTNVPTMTPTDAPSPSPTPAPTALPTRAPTNTFAPTIAPSDVTEEPTNVPSQPPTGAPTEVPTFPSAAPTDIPSAAPSAPPTKAPTVAPTDCPPDDTSSISCDPTEVMLGVNVTCSITRNCQDILTPLRDVEVCVSATDRDDNVPTGWSDFCDLNEETFDFAASSGGTHTFSLQVNGLDAGSTSVVWNTLQPTEYPTPSPTFATPDDTSTFTCENSGGQTGETLVETNVTCSSEFNFMSTTTSTNGSLVAVIVEGGTASDEVVGCTQETSPAMANFGGDVEDIYPNATDGAGLRICFVDASEWDELINSYTWDLGAAAMPNEFAWYRFAMFVYDGVEWRQTGSWANFTIVTEYSATRAEELSIDKAINVNIVFGGKSASGYEATCDGGVNPEATLELDENFDFYDSGALMKGLWLCDELERITDTVMYRSTDQYPCLWREFYNYGVLGINRTRSESIDNWPNVTQLEVNEVLFNFLSYEGGTRFRSDVGLEEGTNLTTWDNDKNSTRVTWIKQQCYTQINEDWGGAKMYEYYEKWEEFMDNFNANKTLASTKLKGFQTSGDYVFMEVEVAFLTGFVQSVIYTLLLCTLTIMIFTWNTAIVIFVCAYILIVVICVVGLYGSMGWEFGAIEVISVPTVVGLSIDYALHVTHSYVHSSYGDRVSRAKSAVDNIGCSVFASAMTTISSMIVLYFAVVVIFSDLGFIVASTGSVGIFISVFVCPPILGLIGPERDQCHIRWWFGLCGLGAFAVKIWGHEHKYLEPKGGPGHIIARFWKSDESDEKEDSGDVELASKPGAADSPGSPGSAGSPGSPGSPKDEQKMDQLETGDDDAMPGSDGPVMVPGGTDGLSYVVRNDNEVVGRAQGASVHSNTSGAYGSYGNYGNQNLGHMAMQDAVPSQSNSSMPGMQNNNNNNNNMNMNNSGNQNSSAYGIPSQSHSPMPPKEGGETIAVSDAALDAMLEQSLSIDDDVADGITAGGDDSVVNIRM